MDELYYAAVFTVQISTLNYSNTDGLGKSVTSLFVDVNTRKQQDFYCY